MAPTSRTPLHTGNDNLRHAISPPALQSMSHRSGRKVSRSNGPNPPLNDWRLRLRSQSRRPVKGSILRLRPDPTGTTTQASSPHAHKRKAPEDDCPRTTKKTKTKALKEYKGDKPTKRKREESLPEDVPNSGGSIAKRHKPITPVQSLTRKNLKLFEKTMAPSSSTKPQSKSAATPSKRSCPTPTELSSSNSLSSRAYSAKDVRFEKALTALKVTVGRSAQQPDAEDVKRLLEVMEKKRDSPEPEFDSGDFYEIVSIVESENEAMVVGRVTTLLWPIRDLTRNNHNTKDLLYRMDTQWQNWGSVQPGELPTGKPDRCILFKGSAFTPDERRQITSPYKDEAGFYPGFICEVKTALQGPKIADRQNANNAISALKADFELQQRLGHEMKMEKKIRLITTAHNTRSQWYTGWFYVLGADGKPEWCPKLIKQVNFEIPEENGFRTARQYNLNICEDLQRVRLPQLRADLAEASRLGSIEMNEVAANVQPSTGWETPPRTPPDDRHDSAVEPQATSKRAKVNTTSGTRSGRCYLKTR